MPRHCQLVFLLLLIVLPIHIVTKEFSVEHGFLNLPLFGKAFLPRALHEVQQTKPPTRSELGYDGQFYAQLALSPLLTDPNLSRGHDGTPGPFDDLQYRARRIGLPMLAYIAGLGNPSWILQAYSTLNLFFWLALMGALARYAGFGGTRERMLAVAVLWTTGTLISVERALTDLPAVTISLWGLMLAETQVATAAGLLAFAAIFRETSVISFPALAWIDRERPPRRLAWVVPLLALPVLLWFAYVTSRTPESTVGLSLFSLPFVGWWEKLSGFVLWQLAPLPKLRHELIPPVAIFIQVAYFAVHPRASSASWRWGVGWACLAMVLGTPVLAEQYAYCRVLLPLTVAFNFLIHQHERDRHYVCWFLLGNLPLFDLAWMNSPRWFVQACLAWCAFEYWHYCSSTRPVAHPS